MAEPTTVNSRWYPARLIKEAIEFHLDGMREEGLAIPDPTTEAEEIVVAA